MSFQDTLDLTVKRFWFLNRSVDRLRAEEGILQMRILGSVTSEEGFNNLFESFQDQRGTIAVYAPPPAILNMDEVQRDPAFNRSALDKWRGSHSVRG